MIAILMISLIFIGIIGAISVLIFLLILPNNKKNKNLKEQSTYNINTLEKLSVDSVNDTILHDDPKPAVYTACSTDKEVANSSPTKFNTSRYIYPLDLNYYNDGYVDFKNRPFFIRNNINNRNWSKYVQYRGTSKEVLSIVKDEAKDGDLAYAEAESEIYIKFADEWLPYTESTYLELLRKISENNANEKI